MAAATERKWRSPSDRAELARAASRRSERVDPAEAVPSGRPEPMRLGRRPRPSGLRREYRVAVMMTSRDVDDLRSVAEAWGVPVSTTAYYLLFGRLSELRRESVSGCGELVRVVSEWLARDGADGLEGVGEGPGLEGDGS